VASILKHPVTYGILATAGIIGLAYYLASVELADGSTRLSGFLTAPANEVGDTLAGFAGTLAFVWIIVTVWLQALELKAQREELRLTRDEMKEQRKATQEIARTAHVQNFDSFFFNLVTSLNSIVESMDIQTKEDKSTLYSGRDCFRYFYNKIRTGPSAETMYPTMAKPEAYLDRCEQVFEEHQSDLGLYFRFVYNTLRVVDESAQAEDRHRRLLRSLFSNEELLVLFYNCLSSKGKKLVPFVERFELFDNLPIDQLVEPSHKNELPAKCFGGSS